jgi:CHAT domain-containing protein
VALLAAWPLSGCRSRVAADPAATFRDIRNDFRQGHLDVARQKAELASKDFSSSDGDWALKFRLLQGEILTDEGRRPEVIALLNCSVVPYPTGGDIAIKRNLLCSWANARLGHAQQADAELEEAKRLSAAGNSDLKGEVLRTEARIEFYRGRLINAADLSRESLNFARAKRDSFLEASDLLNLGLVALKLEHYDEAVALLNEAADSARPIQARMLLQLALGNMGVAYSGLGDYEKALPNFQLAEQAARQIGATSTLSDWLWSAGSAYYKLGNLPAATNCYQEGLQEALAIHSLEEIAGIHTQLAFLLYQEGVFDSAKTHSDQAIQAARLSGDEAGELEPSFLQALLAERQANGQDAERLLMQVYGKSTGRPSLRWEIENALANLYAGKQRSKQADIWYRKSIHTFEDQRSAVREEELRLPFFANGDALYRDYAGFLIASHKQELALQWLDIGRAKTLAEGLGPVMQMSSARPEQAVDVQAVARKLDSVILFYALGPQKSYLWAATPHHTRLFLLPAQAVIEAQVRGYQKDILKSGDPLREVNQNARALFDTLVGPADGMIPKGSKVHVIPDGILNGLNFETLLTPESSSHYWIEDVTVSNANSIRLLSRLETGTPSGDTRNLLLIGNPVAVGTGYERLVNAFAEIRGLEKHFPPDSRTVITQSEATPASYTNSKPDQFEYIHFVAHGTASELSPLDSAVVLSAPPGNPDDFKLYAREIMRSPLHAKLVTISSCYGSGLRSYAGEGLVGLSWAFLRAGSHNVIGALWEVNDASTPLLMDRLYGELAAGHSPDEALRTAKLSLIHTQTVYRKPLYWAAFQLYSGS